MSVDWTTTDDCERCNQHGPFLPGGVLYDEEWARDLHQSWHGLVAAYLNTLRIPQAVRWLSERL